MERETIYKPQKITRYDEIDGNNSSLALHHILIIDILTHEILIFCLYCGALFIIYILAELCIFFFCTDKDSDKSSEDSTRSQVRKIPIRRHSDEFEDLPAYQRIKDCRARQYMRNRRKTIT